MIAASLLEIVKQRAFGRCEYCRFPERFSETPFQLEHIVSQQHGGTSEADNLAWACFYCNKCKGPNIAGLDPVSNRLTRLFHPRRDTWSDHFQWRDAELIGLSSVGRTTIVVLGINRPLVVARRAALIAEGVYPL